MESSAFIFFGRSGSGKGTQVELLKKYLEEQGKTVLHFETGALFRKLEEKDSFTGIRIKETIEHGRLLPEFMPIWGWGNFLINSYTGKEILIFDGTRKLGEFERLEEALSFYGIVKKYIIFIHTSEAWSAERLRGRGRSDDDDDEIQSRMQFFKNEVVPTIEYARKNSNLKFIEIDGEQTIENVHRDILKSLGFSG